MGITITQQGDRLQVALHDEMSIYSAAELQQQLLPLLQEQTQLTLDLAAVTEFDSAGLQLLIVLKQEALQRQQTLQIINHSEPVVAVLKLLNMIAFFGDPVLLSAERQRSGARDG